MVHIRVLGGVGATSGDGEAVDVGPTKCQALLVALALAPGRAVPVERLVTLVWGEDPPRTAEKTLQTYVGRLRRALGPDVVVRVGGAYRLDVAPDAVDAVRFLGLLDEGRVGDALATWTGPPAAGLDAPGLTATVDGLAERWLGAVELDLGREVDDDPGAAVARLTDLTTAHPYREGLWALLMTALYRSGRQADALAAYATARDRLVDDLGVEPGPRLRALEAAVLAQDPALDVPTAAPARPARPTIPTPTTTSGGAPHPPADRTPQTGVAGNLPRRIPAPVGRDDDADRVAAELETAPVVTLVGPGGIGKTTLALAVAGRREEVTAWLVPLSEVATGSEVARAVAAAVGAPEAAGRTLTDAVVATLADRPALLVLDSCEHVLDGAAALARAVVERSPATTVLATSRERLGLVDERVVPVAPLAPADAVALFAARARAAGAQLDLGSCRSEVEEICRHLDGLPLAIELAAARTSALAPSDLVARLDDHLTLLAGGRGTEDRHRTLRATIDWSHDLLDDEERVVLRRLSTFAGPFDLEAAEEVAGDADLDPATVDVALAGLVDRSMVVATATAGGRRYRLLEVLRQHAAEHLAAAGETDATEARHLAWATGATGAVGRDLAGWGEVAAVDRLTELWPNLRAAVDRACARGDAAGAHDLVHPIGHEVFLRSRNEVADWAERILDLAPPDADDVVVSCLVWASRRAMRTGDRARYRALVARHGEPDHPLVHHARAFVDQDQVALLRWCPPCAELLRQQGEDHAAVLFDIGSGRALLSMGRDAEHDALMAPLLARLRVEGPPTFLGWVLAMLGYSARRQGRRDEAGRLFDEVLTVEVPARTASRATPIRAEAALRRGDRATALRLLRAHLDELQEVDDLHEGWAMAREVVLVATKLGRRPAVARLRRVLDDPTTEPDLDALGMVHLVAEVLDRLIDEG